MEADCLLVYVAFLFNSIQKIGFWRILAAISVHQLKRMESLEKHARCAYELFERNLPLYSHHFQMENFDSNAKACIHYKLMMVLWWCFPHGIWKFICLDFVLVSNWDTWNAFSFSCLQSIWTKTKSLLWYHFVIMLLANNLKRLY